MKTRLYRARGASKCSMPGCKKPYYGATFCKAHHQWHWKRGLLPEAITISIADKLRLYSKRQPNGCIIWMRGKNSNGYGHFALPGGRRRYAHRIAYQTYIGKISKGLEVCHSCDQPACINPEHLFLGTHRENMSDAKSKGRLRAPPPMMGTDHPRACFTAAEVNAIRSSTATAVDLARRLGAHPETVRRCRRGETY